MDDKKINETLTYSDYEIVKEKQSQIDPDLIITVSVGMKCPKCKTKMNKMRHFETRFCTCGLNMVLRGNALKCFLISNKITTPNK